MNRIRNCLAVLGLLVATTTIGPSHTAYAASAEELNTDGKAALDRLLASSDRARRISGDAKAILVFPRIVKAGFLVGGQSGEGVLFVNGQPQGYYRISAASFGALSLYGYTTQRDLSGFGSFLIMGLFGIIIASLVNIFLKSSGLDWIVSVLGVFIFAGLTAYDTQKIKEMYSAMDDGSVDSRKAVMGALSLYLDFINLFLMLLRLFGDRR